jgi:starvation-inducible DNA-binding protein
MAAKTAARTFDTHIDITEGVRAKEIDLLNQQLADSFDLYSQLKQAHWNVKGKDFFQLHELFDTLAEGVLGFVDLIAERATALGGTATGTVRMAAGATSLPEYPDDVVEGMDHVTCLVDRYGRYAKTTREAINTTDGWGDPTTADLFTEISREVDKQLYFLESHIQA